MLCLENREEIQYEILEMIYPISAAVHVHFLKISHSGVQYL